MLRLDDVVRFRAFCCLTTNQKTALGSSVILFDKLRALPGIAHLLPPAPLSRLPRMRLANGERLAATPASFRAEWSIWRDGYQAGTPSALSGSAEDKAGGYMGQFDAGLAWLIEMAGELELADPSELADLRALARPDWIKAAAQSVASAYDEDGELVDDDAPARLSLRSLRTYLQRPRTVFESLDCDVASAAVDRLLEDPKLKGVDGMSPANIVFCKAVVTSPAKQAILFGIPWMLQEKAQALLDEWDSLSTARRYEAVRAGACAVAMLLMTRCAPVRMANLAAITFRGRKGWLSAPKAGGLVLLLIPASQTKNRREIRAHLRDAGKKRGWALVSWYLAEIRPRMVALGGLPTEVADGPALFPGLKDDRIGHSTLRDWIKMETAACGLPMRPHQARHALASILLNRDSSKLPQVAALLGDRISTVEKAYAWMDEEQLVADAQAMIPTAAAVLRGARRG